MRSGFTDDFRTYIRFRISFIFVFSLQLLSGVMTEIPTDKSLHMVIDVFVTAFLASLGYSLIK